MATQLGEDQRGSSVNIKPRSATAPYEKTQKEKIKHHQLSYMKTIVLETSVVLEGLS